MVNKLQEISLKVPVKNPFYIVEELGIPMPPMLIPGHLYYLNIEPDEQVIPDKLPINSHEFRENRDEKHYMTSKPYYDIAPIGIALRFEGDSDQYQSILNLKVMSPQFRRLILASYYSILERNELISKWFNKDLTQAKSPIDKRLRESQYINPFNTVTKDFMQKILNNRNISFAVKSYKMDTIKEAKLLDWNALPSIYNMNNTDSGIIINNQIGGIQEIQDTFESKFYPI